MKNLFKKTLAGAFLASLFLNANAQTWNIPTSIASPSSTYLGTTSGTTTIGTASSADLFLRTAGVDRFRIAATSPATSSTFQLLGDNNYLIFGGSGHGLIHWSNASDLYFRTLTNTNDIGSQTTRVTIKGDGKVGIGTTTPAYLLDVNGTAAMTGFKLGSSATAGYVLTTNASGVGTWAAPTGTSQWTTSGSNISYSTGSVGIGTSTPNSLSKLHVNGAVVIGNPSLTIPNISGTSVPYSTSGYGLYVQYGILTEKMKVAVSSSSDWSDFVFSKNYKLRSLTSVEQFISENHHLPDVPSADEVAANGIDVAKMDAKLLQKIEELTLYMIEMKKENEQMKTQNEELKKEMIELKDRLK